MIASTGGAIRARRAVEALLDRCGETHARIEKVTRLEQGMFRAGYGVVVSGTTALPALLVALVPRVDGSSEMVEACQREAAILRCLAGCCQGMGFPSFIGVEESEGLPILITSFVAGLSFGPRGFRKDPSEYFESVARAASIIHALPQNEFHEVLSGPATCRDFAQARLLTFSKHPDTDIARAFSWCTERLPHDESTVVLHGDLMGQNLMVDVNDPSRLSVIDWSDCCFGDPAFDIAVVTRGVRNPMKLVRGRERLVSRYNELSGRVVSIERVYLYEVILVMGWLARYLEEDPSSGVVGEERARLQSIMAGFR